MTRFPFGEISPIAEERNYIRPPPIHPTQQHHILNERPQHPLQFLKAVNGRKCRESITLDKLSVFLSIRWKLIFWREIRDHLWWSLYSTIRGETKC